MTQFMKFWYNTQRRRPKGRGHRDAEKVLRLERRIPAALAFMMDDKTLSVFVDESGNLSCARDSSRFYIVSLVLHDQSDAIDGLVRELDSAYDSMGLSNLCFHAGPIIRREEGYEYMNWELRSRIFAKMMAFARRAPFRYRCLCVDKNFARSEEQVIARLEAGFCEFLDSISVLPGIGRIKVYYDCGQTALTKVVHSAMSSRFGDEWDFAQGVRPSRYRLFQLADLVCTVSLIDCKLAEGLPMTKSEEVFFGGPRNFKRKVMKPLLRKRM